MGFLRRASKTLKSSKYLPLLQTNSKFSPISSLSRRNPLYSEFSYGHFGLSQAFCSHSRKNGKDSDIDLSQYPTERIRNFSIIAHVDHGKSTLADRLLELTGTIKRGHGQPQYLDKLQVERERGITVKAQTATMFYKHNFMVQTTMVTMKNQPTADPDRVKAQLKSMFDLDASDALLTSAKTGQGLEQVIPAVIERIPPPPGKSNSPLRMLLLDSYYDEYKGGDKVLSAATGQAYEILDVGVMHPELTPTGVLHTGQVGYVVTGMRSTKEARIGTHFIIIEPLLSPSRVQACKTYGFSGLYPADGCDFEELNHAIERLTCNDASVSVVKESSTALGMGFRCGFLGLLHMDVFHQRLEQERNVIKNFMICMFHNFLVVIDKIRIHVSFMDNRSMEFMLFLPFQLFLIFEYSDGSKVEVQNPATLPSNPKQRVTACWEPTVLATIIIPSEYVGAVITLCSERRGQQLEYSFIDSQRAFMKYQLPLREIVVDFYNELKSLTSGYASFDYEDAEYQQSDMVKLDILLNGQPVDAMATIVHNLKAQRVGRALVEKLKKHIDRSVYLYKMDFCYEKNVLAKCYGGDITRKKKLLEKQKEGKKRMKRVGSVDIPQEAFHELLKSS
ncbi:translation factor GUF1 homolog mitochondrial [Prunus yedoensis var. nudiflora]|uniref:Translation factor GUF1 homolog mitochondrial n=1 Tax=Prunus yedoensis var. nudiflora TaxID=2094558 RepID=A0A314UGR2_PRUYE|nr:translation factor GUF1 homolog mitochondrial [Prunus yedoensis var. nudiflora]